MVYDFIFRYFIAFLYDLVQLILTDAEEHTEHLCELNDQYRIDALNILEEQEQIIKNRQSLIS